MFAQHANSIDTLSFDQSSSEKSLEEKTNFNRVFTEKKLGNNAVRNSPCQDKTNRPSNIFRSTLKKHLSLVRYSN